MRESKALKTIRGKNPLLIARKYAVDATVVLPCVFVTHKVCLIGISSSVSGSMFSLLDPQPVSRSYRKTDSRLVYKTFLSKKETSLLLYHIQRYLLKEWYSNNNQRLTRHYIEINFFFVIQLETIFHLFDRPINTENFQYFYLNKQLNVIYYLYMTG